MELLKKLIAKLGAHRTNVAELKLWLAQKEVVEYSNWKEENPKDRTAIDKVVALLKLEDENWLLKEKEYVVAKLQYDLHKNVYDVAIILLQTEGTEYTEEFIKNTIKV